MKQLDAGVDEAGRGCLIGKVFAAAVILPEHYDLPHLNDSKKLSESKRNTLAQLIKQQALAWCVASATPEEIQQLNIFHATLLAMRRSILGLHLVPAKVWVDGKHIPPHLNVPAEAIVGGDAIKPNISSASILAKTAKDAEMHLLAQQYPEYGFHQNKGYGTPAHLRALHQHGVLPEHRRDFAPIKHLIAQKPLL